MTREKEIRQEAIEVTHFAQFGHSGRDMVVAYDAFILGAQWADAHPQFDKEAFMEKACWWLRETAHFYVSDFTGELDDNGLLENFKRAMDE